MKLNNNKCVICKKKADRHHIRHRAQGIIDDDWNILLLCRPHHIEWHQIGPLKFIKKYPISWDVLQTKGWQWLNKKLFNDKILDKALVK